MDFFLHSLEYSRKTTRKRMYFSVKTFRQGLKLEDKMVYSLSHLAKILAKNRRTSNNLKQTDYMFCLLVLPNILHAHRGKPGEKAGEN